VYVPGGRPIHLIIPFENCFTGLKKCWPPISQQGCGMGYFSIAMAGMVGGRGKILRLGLQPKMLEITEKRARRANFNNRMAIKGRVFILIYPDA
jgi:hypothetical protein